MLAIWANMAAFLSDEVVRTAVWAAKPGGLAFLVIKGHVFFRESFLHLHECP